MHTIDLAYVGRGIHEELVAQVADQEGYFEDEGVHVALRMEPVGTSSVYAPVRPSGSAGACFAADRGHRVDRAERQHRPSIVLVPRQRRA